MAEENKEGLFEGMDMSILSSVQDIIQPVETKEEDNIVPPVEQEQTEEENIDTPPSTGDETNEEPEVNEPNVEEPETQEEEIDDNSSLTPYANLLVEEGILSAFDEEEFDGSAESLLALQQKQIEAKVEQQINELTGGSDRVKAFLEAERAGVPFETLIQLDAQKMTYNSITDEQLDGNEDLQRQIVGDYLRKVSPAADDTFINKQVDMMFTVGEGETEAKELLGKLKEITVQEEQYALEQAKAQQVEFERAREQQLGDLKNTIFGVEEIIPGLAVNDNIKGDIYNMLTTAVDYDQFGNPINEIVKARNEDPFGFETAVAYLYKLTKGFKDYTPLQSSGKKQAYKQLIDASNNLDNKTKSSSPRKTNVKTQSLINAMQNVKFNNK